MKLRNLIFIKEDNIEIIGSLYPSFFYRISPIMRDYLKLFKHNNENEINNTLAIKYSEEPGLALEPISGNIPPTAIVGSLETIHADNIELVVVFP